MAIKDMALLQALISARGPSGQEDEVRVLCEKEFKALTSDTWIDPAGNVVAKITGTDPSLESLQIHVHMDELSLIVKRVNEDGSLRVNPLGGIYPANYGQGPVDIMGDHKTCLGILSYGSMHTTKETPNINKIAFKDHRGLGETPGWEDVKIVTRMSTQELKEAGIHAGTRVVIAASRRQIQTFQDCLACYFLDNRASIFIALTALKNMKLNGKKPKRDLYFVATCSEEIGCHGASYAARTLPGEIVLAIDVGPAAKEYEIELSATPIVVYQDTVAAYDKNISDRMVFLGEKLGLKPQCATWGGYGSDASLAHSRGQAAKAALICFPVENTHGYEITHKDSLHQCAVLLEAYILD